MDPQIGVKPGPESRYYTKLGRASDFILRCSSCQTIQKIDDIKKAGGCPGDVTKVCGGRRFTEITLLNEAEMTRIQSGALDFPYREEFLKEFETRV